MVRQGAKPHLKTARTIASVLLVACLAIGAGWRMLLPFTEPTETSKRVGWSILRPPYDVNALVSYQGLIFAGGRDGLTVIDPHTSAVQPLPQGTPEMTYARALMIDSKGRLWVGHRTGVARFNGTNWQAFTVSPNAPPGPVTAIIETRAGKIFVGGEAGLAIVDGNTLKPVQVPQGRENGGVFALLEDRQTRLWVGFSSPTNGGLLVLDNGNWHDLGLQDKLAHLSINHIIEDADGHIHIATGFSGRGGACRLEKPDDLRSWQCLSSADGLASDMVRLVFQDSRQQIWYGSEFRGAAIAHDGQFTRVGLADAMAGTELKAMLEDPSGNLWLGCDKGLTRIAAGAATLIE